MAVPSLNLHPIRKVNPYAFRLLESYCPGCGLLIAASPSREILAMMEKLYVCPVYFRYSQRTA